MTSAPGEHYSVHIGGDAKGPVVVGHGHHVEFTTAPPAATRDAPAATQTNTAREQGTVYAVTGGDMHIHQNLSGPAAALAEDPEASAGA